MKKRKREGLIWGDVDKRKETYKRRRNMSSRVGSVPINLGVFVGGGGGWSSGVGGWGGGVGRGFGVEVGTL